MILLHKKTNNKRTNNKIIKNKKTNNRKNQFLLIKKKIIQNPFLKYLEERTITNNLYLFLHLELAMIKLKK